MTIKRKGEYKNMSFREEVNQTKRFAAQSNTLINQVKDNIMNGAARGLSSNS